MEEEEKKEEEEEKKKEEEEEEERKTTGLVTNPLLLPALFLGTAMALGIRRLNSGTFSPGKTSLWRASRRPS